MKKVIFFLALSGLLLTAFGPSQSVSSDIEIKAPTAKVWDVITNPKYAKILGNEFDKNSFMESDWKLGSEVYFKYEPDKVVTTGTISKLIKDQLIQIDYNFSGFSYTEKFELMGKKDISVLKLFAGPYSADYEAQIVVWNNWLKKVKELSEAK